MKQYDVETKCTYNTWVRVQAENEFAAQKESKRYGMGHHCYTVSNHGRV